MNRNWKTLFLLLSVRALLVCSNLVVGVACGNQTQSTTTDQADTTTTAKKKSITNAADQAPKSAPASTPAASTTPAAKPAVRGAFASSKPVSTPAAAQQAPPGNSNGMVWVNTHEDLQQAWIARLRQDQSRASI